jgi:hypothetical protein
VRKVIFRIKITTVSRIIAPLPFFTAEASGFTANMQKLYMKINKGMIISQKGKGRRQKTERITSPLSLLSLKERGNCNSPGVLHSSG